MTDLPTSIESALLDAGFSGTEVVTIKKLLQEDSMTLRELAAKTGKSTGVLDQAIKKLLKKGIVSREVINEHPKYTLKSLDVVLKWMEDDTKVKQEMIVRRHQNFETFVRSLVETQHGNRRPEIEYFEGHEGMKKAYMQLLNKGNDIAQYRPTLFLAEEDPLRECKVQWFRERQRRGIFSRVITHDTVLGRRFHSRDPFEYRKTILVDEDTYPFNFEKIIIGDTIACFEVENERACFIRYPEYAENERMFFDRLWNKKMKHATSHVYPHDAEGNPIPPSEIITVPFATKTLSSFREFILSRRSMSVLVGLGLFTAALTYGFYLRDVAMNTKRVQDRALSIAATGALQFDIADLDQLHTINDISKPAYAKVVYQLNLIRSQNPGTKYAYIMRPTDDPLILEFVADADSLDPYKKGDLNHDAVIDEADDLPIPGESFDISHYRWMQKVFLKDEAIVSDFPETDKWGTFLSGIGPIKDQSGKTIALFGVDIESSTVQDLSTNMVVLFGIFISLFLLLVLIRLMAFNRSLSQEIYESLKKRRQLILLSTGLCIALALTFMVPTSIILLPGILYGVIVLFYYLLWSPGIRASLFYVLFKRFGTRNTFVKIGLAFVCLYWVVFSVYLYVDHIIAVQTGKRLVAIASTAALQINPDDLENIHFARDMKRPEYQRVFNQLNAIRKQNPEIMYVYILRPTETEGMWEFVVDADTNYFLPFNGDFIGDNAVDEMDESSPPGIRYDIAFSAPKIFQNGLNSSIFEDSMIFNQWGSALTGSAPILDKNRKPIAILGVDSW